MPKERETALVILGAGASHDVVPTHRDDPNRFITPVVADLKPVLAEHIFTDSRPVREALEAYTNVNEVSSDLRDLEKGLEDTLRELSRSAMPLMQRGIKEMPLYLRHLFTSLSAFTTDPINYKKLVHRLFDNSGFDRVAFVSLNYDQLLDRVLEFKDFGGAFDSMEAYDRLDINPHFLYVKLHGSTNWAWPLAGFDALRVREIVATTSYQATVDRYLDLIHGADLPPDLGVPVIVDPRDHFEGDMPLYPALAIPTGEYDFICPDAHVDKLGEFLSTCGNVLLIGCSAQDQRFLDFLRSNLPTMILNFALVNRGAGPTETLRDRLFEQVPALAISKQFHLKVYDQGFSEFLRRGGLDEFINAAGRR